MQLVLSQAISLLNPDDILWVGRFPGLPCGGSGRTIAEAIEHACNGLERYMDYLKLQKKNSPV